MVYKTKIEAEKALNESKRDSRSKYCPLTRRPCSIKCVCYSEGRVKENSGSVTYKYYVYMAGCTNVMFIGGE